MSALTGTGVSEIVQRLNDFVAYRRLLTGDEKGEAQVFCDRLFQPRSENGRLRRRGN